MWGMRSGCRAQASFRRAVWPVALAGTILVGCGKVGPPLPPEPRGPLSPGKVVARQIGRQVIVAFTVSLPRGMRPAQQPGRAEVVRVDYEPGRRAPADPDAFRRRGRTIATLDLEPLEPGSRQRVTDPTLDWQGDDPTGRTLRYGVRILDRRGRPSPLVVARDLVAVDPPPPPAGLTAEATGDGIRLEWQAPPGENAGFNVYRGSAQGSIPEQPVNASPLAATRFLDSEVVTASAYVYLVRTAAAADRPFRESESSAPVRIVAEDRFAPGPPDGLVAIQEGEAVRLFWNPNDEQDLRGYRLYRSVDGGAWARVGPDVIHEPLYLDRDVRIGQVLTYAVTAVDRATPPNESPRSVTARIDLAAVPLSGDE